MTMALYAGGTLLHLARFRPLLIFESWRTPRSSDLPQAGWGTVPTSRCRRRHCRSWLFRRRTWGWRINSFGHLHSSFRGLRQFNARRFLAWRDGFADRRSVVESIC